MPDDHLSRGGARRPRVLTCRPEDAPGDAAERMVRHNVGSLVVTDADGNLVGIVSERDLLSCMVPRPGRARPESVAEVMQTDVVCRGPKTPMREIQGLMARRRIRHLPLVDDGIPVGMVSARDVMDYQHRRDVEMRHSAEEVARLFASLKSIDLDEVVDLVTRQVPRVLNARRSVLCFPEDDEEHGVQWRVHRGGCACPADGLHAPRDPEAEPESADEDGTCRECLTAGSVADSRLIPLHLPSVEERPEAAELPAYLCMCGFAAAEEVSWELVDYKISLLRDAVAANLENAELFRRYKLARMAAMTDPLTQAATRQVFEATLKAECDRARRYPRPVAVAIIDVDHFKLINDRRGHAVGDAVLVRVARAMKESLRSVDTFARYGGDEFIILLPETDKYMAAACLDRLRAAVESITEPDLPPLSVSIGCAVRTRSEDLPPDTLMARADDALYDAKRAGRNRVRFWGGDVKRTQEDDRLSWSEVRSLRDRVGTLMSRSREVFMQSVYSLVQALDARDPYTKRHSENVMRLAVGIGEQMEMPPEDIDVLRRAAIMHDLGKIGVPDSVLLKPGDLAPGELEIMRQHPLIAVRILDQMRFLDREIPIIRQHHERWDGGGYPDGFAGKAICPGARVLAVADALDAITSTRNYHQARDLTEAMDILEGAAGEQFDPECIAALRRWTCRVQSSGIEPTIRDLLASKADCVFAA